MTDPMKALTLYQPWASLMAMGEKTLETRSWATTHRGDLAIHAAKSTPKHYQTAASMNAYITRALEAHGLVRLNLPHSRVLCIVELVDVFRVTELHKAEFVLGRKISAREIHFGDYSPGRFAWVTRNVRLVEDDGPTSGGQGLWSWVRGPKPEAVRQAEANASYDRGETTL